MKSRIIGFLSLLFLVFLVGAVISILYITSTTAELKKIITLHSVEILRQDLIIRIQNVERDLLTARTELEGSIDNVVSNVSDLDKSIVGCMGCHHSPLISQKLNDIKGYIGKFEAAFSSYITATAGNRRTREHKLQSYNISKELLKITLEMSLIADQRLKQRTQEALGAVRTAQWTLLGTLLIALLIGLWIAVRLTNRIVRPVRELIGMSRKIGSGELGNRTTYSDDTEFGELASAFNDMSASLRQMQEELVHTARLAAVGELASNVAHEISSPITNILGYAELMREETDIGNIMKDVEVIKSESMRARGIVRQLLEFARKRPAEMEEVNINALLKEVIALVAPRIKNSGISVKEDYSDLASVMADPNQMKQVFLNVLNNAVDAMTESCEKSDKVLAISTSKLDSGVAIEIADTGCGISGEVLPRIFEPFFSARKVHGTGLGLSITDKIVQSHKGKIEVRSEEGLGTTFLIYLPAAGNVQTEK